MSEQDALCFDLIIRGGTVVDGSGGEPFVADVGVRGERIVAIGDLRAAHAPCVIEAAGLCVAPGFIDIHTHSDISLLYNPQQTSALAQGITTQVVGNCGIAMGMITDEPIFAYERRWLAPYGIRVTWEGRLARFYELVGERGTATHIIPQVAHGTLRKRVMGMERRPPTSAELGQMQHLMEQAVEDGVWGFSTGLEYAPGSYAQTEEIIALAKVAAKHGLFYSTHLRDEADRLVEAVQEALRIGEEAGIAVQLSHHKADGERNWGLVQRTLQMVEKARAKGMDVMLDQYPYDAYLTSLLTGILPDWATEGGPDAIVHRLTAPSVREQIRSEILVLHPDWNEPDHWQRVVIAVARNNRDLQGKSILHIAHERGCHPLDCVLDILIEEHTFVSAARFTLSEEDVQTVLRYPLTMIGSDAIATAPLGKMSVDRVHPRNYGTFPRVLGRYVRELRLLSLPEAVHKMTGLPARRLGLHDRGILREGSVADITVFNPITVQDRATFEEPHQLPVGIEYVLVCGKVALERGVPTGTLAGQVLRRRPA
ncbi:MAG: dihydroorotase [Armatimonadota bacterium]|nr:MAG: dihydroorotase [Armatimonadota bacterium]